MTGPPNRSARTRLVTPAFARIAASVAAFFVAGGMFVPATPRFVTGALGGDALGVGVAVGSFGIAAIALRPLGGRWADRRGRRLLLVTGAAVQVIAAAGHLLASSLVLLVVMRLLLGAAEALFFVGALAAVTDLAPEERRGEAVNLISTALYLGVALGPIAAEWLYAAGGFDWVWIAAALVAVVAVVLAFAAPETLQPAARRRERDEAPILHPRGLVPGLLVLTGAWGMGAYLAFLPLLGDELRLPGVGGYFGAFAIAIVVLRLAGARLPDRLGAARLSGTALVLSAAGMAIAGLVPTETGLWLATLVYAAGVAFTFPAIVSLAVQGVPPNERGAVVGTTSLFLDVAFGLSPAVLGLVATATGYPAAFLISAVVALLGAAWLLQGGAVRMAHAPAQGPGRS